MDLHGSFRDAQIASDLLIQPSGSDLSQNYALTGRQHIESRTARAHCCLILPALTVSGETDIYCVQKILFPERLCKKLDGAGLHRPYAHRDVAMAGNKDDRERAARRGQLTLKIQPALTWQGSRSTGTAATG